MDQAARGSAALSAGFYTEAVKQYTSAISQSPKAVDYYIKRSTAYQRTGDHQSSLKDAEIAVVLAMQRGKRELIVQAQIRRAIALYGLGKYADCVHLTNIIKERGTSDKTVHIWSLKAEQKLSPLPSGDPAFEVSISEIPDVEVPSAESVKIATPLDTDKVNQEQRAQGAVSVGAQTPADKIKHDWYQNAEYIYVSIMAKGVPKDETTVDIQDESLNVSFPIASGSNFNFSLDPLFATIDASKSSFKIVSTKIEITLKKVTPAKWSKLESQGPSDQSILAPIQNHRQAAPSYPTSSRTGPKNWDKLADDLTKGPKKETEDSKNSMDDFDDEEGDPVNGFFKKLYAGADPDTRRAMMKSYQESNGTALSTNWEEVKKAPVETTPPDGMEAKPWGT
ncbi:SGS-domain-containing protein [Patellaria atrata CBS 101060]|uniref:SGS-domain-containing protein n=1 Tax=Patellaria atrata CBS 101060 TaxID=1346257 RepID=A0A9P4SGH0_9PEZI|nr:SGS-domain-containing protein [Patellaria atrata CBS 101060]